MLQNPSNPTCIDLFLTNAPRSFQSTCVVETGLFYFHLITMTVMSISFKKIQPNIISYGSYKILYNDSFRETLINKLSIEDLFNNNNGFQRFCDINLET